MSPGVVTNYPMESGADDVMAEHLRGSGGMRSTHRIAKIAWTLADMDGRQRPTVRHAREAIDLHRPLGDEAT